MHKSVRQSTPKVDYPDGIMSSLNLIIVRMKKGTYL